MANKCSMCLMPFSKDPGNRKNPEYCSYCFGDEGLRFKGDDIEEFKAMCYKNMVKNGMNKYLAKAFTFTINFAPHWKKIKRQNQRPDS